MRDHPRASFRWRELFIQGLVALALLAGAFPGTFFQGELISPADILFKVPPWQYYAPEGWTAPQNCLMLDMLTAFRPYYVLTERALNNGEWPLWNPLEFWGMPLLANSQCAVFYPPRLLHTFLDVQVATTLYILLKLWLCAMTAYICARGLRLGVPAARFLSVAWMLGGFSLIWCNWSITDVGVWVPVLFLGIESVLAAKYARGFFTMLLGATLILLAGHPETAFTMCLGLGFYFLLRLVWERRWGRELWMPVGVCAAAWSAALLVCAVQLIPFLEYLTHSHTFFNRYSGGKQLWYKPGVLSVFWIPRFFGTMAEDNYWGKINSNLDSMLYPGMAVWFGISLVFARRGKNRTSGAQPSGLQKLYRNQDPRVACLMLTALAGVLLAFDVPALKWLNRLPVLNSAYFVYHICFALFALPLLGALGLDRWVAQARPVRSLAWALPVILAGVCIVGYIYWFSASLIYALDMNTYILRDTLVALGLAVVCLGLLAAHCFRINAKVVLGLLTLVLACDLLYANRGLNPTMPKEQILPETDLTSYLQGLGHPCRIGMPEAGVPGGLMVSYDLEDWLGYDGLYPGRIIRFVQTLETDLWGNIEPVRSIPYFLHDPRFESFLPPEQRERLEYVTKLDGIEVYRNPRALPRTFLVGQTQLVPDIEEMFEIMRSEDYDPKRVALIERPLPGELHQTTAEDLGSATVQEWLSTKVTVRAEAKQNCVLVLADAYYPGWKATIDGEPADIFPVYYVFRGLLLPAGEHTIEYVYDPWTFRAGLTISTMALLASGLAAVVLLVRKSRRSSVHAA